MASNIRRTLLTIRASAVIACPCRSPDRRRAALGTCSAYTDPKRAAVGETTFLVEDYVPDRIEFDLTSPTGQISQKVPAEVTLTGRFLYGAPAAGLDLEGEISIDGCEGAAGFPRLSVRPRR